MPETGIEPVRVLPRRILSPVRLPVPPLGQTSFSSASHLIGDCLIIIPCLKQFVNRFFTFFYFSDTHQINAPLLRKKAASLLPCSNERQSASLAKSYCRRSDKMCQTFSLSAMIFFPLATIVCRVPPSTASTIPFSNDHSRIEAAFSVSIQ